MCKQNVQAVFPAFKLLKFNRMMSKACVKASSNLLACRYFPTILIVMLAVFNDGAMIALSKDRVISSPVPNHWNLRNIFIIGAHAVKYPNKSLCFLRRKESL